MRRWALACACVLWGGIASANPISAPVIDYHTVNQMRELLIANGGSITWDSDLEALAVTYWTPQAGPQARVGRAISLLDYYENGNHTWFTLTLASLNKLTCGGVQADFEQYPLNRTTNVALVIDSEVNCASEMVSFGATQTAFTPVPEPGSLALLGTGLCGLAWWARKRFV